MGFELFSKQECIPVGCVPPAEMAFSLATHAPWPRTPPCHACSPATHAPCHACPLPHMPPAMHASSPCPCMPPVMHLPGHTCPPPNMHTPPPAMHTPLWTEFLIHTCENITLPQLVAGGNKVTSVFERH